MYIDKRLILFLILAMILWEGINFLTNPDNLLVLLLTIPGVLIAITFHEFAHAWAADKLGDDTPRSEGRLSLNPSAHLDPIGSVMLLFAGFGWGKPVHVNPRNYNRDISMDKADAIVSAAGPIMNFILAIILTLIYCAAWKFAGVTVMTSNVLYIIIQMLQIAISINIGLGIFNLIPLPPLDGSKVIKPILSYNAKMWFENHEQIFYIVFVALWIIGILGMIISPIIDTVYSGIMSLGLKIFGL